MTTLADHDETLDTVRGPRTKEIDVSPAHEIDVFNDQRCAGYFVKVEEGTIVVRPCLLAHKLFCDQYERVIKRRGSAVPPRAPISRPAKTCASRARTSSGHCRDRLPARARCRAATPRAPSRAAARSRAPAATRRARGAPALREASHLISFRSPRSSFIPLPLRTQRVHSLVDVPARVVAVEAETDASLAVPCEHTAPRDSVDDRLR